MTAPPDSPATRTQSQTIPEQLLNTRKNLVKSKFYLGHKSVFDNVHWVRDGRAHRLAVKPTAVIEHDHNSDSPQTYPSPPPDGDFNMAHLSAIVQIDNNDFWLTSDAGYRKPSAIWPGLASVKPSCAATEPHVQPVKDDFKTVVENLRQLQSLTSTPGYQQGKGLLLPTAVHGPRFKVRHTLFDVSTTNFIVFGIILQIYYYHSLSVLMNSTKTSSPLVVRQRTQQRMAMKVLMTCVSFPSSRGIAA